MPFLNNVLNVKELVYKLNSTNFLCTWKTCKLHIECVQHTYIECNNVKKTYINSLLKRTHRKRLLLFSKGEKYVFAVKGKKMHNAKSRKRKNKFASKWRNKYLLHKVHIDLLNEELKNVEKKINGKCMDKITDKEISVAHFKYPSQKLYKASEEEINLINKSERQYYLPLECENSTIIRLINIKNKVSSPIFRCVRNSRFGLRKNERIFFFFYSSLICSFCFLMGLWQYKKVGKKKFLIDYILHNLNKPIIGLGDSNFPWYDDFSTLKKNSKNFNQNLVQYENENDFLRSVNVLNAFFRVLSFYEQIKVFHNQIFRKMDKLNHNSESEIDMREIHVQNDDVRISNSDIRNEERNKLTIDLENVHNVHEWMSRIRNENFAISFWRKFFKKDVTEDELKKIVIEKYKYRRVQLTGVLDTTNEFYVGPKLQEQSKKKNYYYVICPIFLKNGKCILVNRGLISEEILVEKKKEMPKVVTIRGVLDPGELYESSFKKIKNFSNKNVYSNYLYYYNVEEICHHANISHFKGSTFFIANIYDIIVHEDYNNDIIKDHYSNWNKDGTNLLDSHMCKLNGITINDMDRESQERIKRLLKVGDNCKSGINNRNETYSSVQNGKPFRYDEHFIHKKKREYYKFYADETTHFNYACQWFLFSFVFSTISVFKFLQFKKWVF
ncbi:hypothetical protein, conserved [Plasmodium gonderi]|uniref:SURF1-like protein n=1 Tax=Plasmodium gonderi TaxID=77519 RepID=A0A1Y1JFE7_PLAGO|nr:hypothetical protein, conserved [Plasmodium gonderi]GAW81251.1 hypothetical protein, conserved [Plasmodium gonderi]